VLRRKTIRRAIHPGFRRTAIETDTAVIEADLQLGRDKYDSQLGHIAVAVDDAYKAARK